MTDDPPHWFGEPLEDETPAVDPPTVAADWFSDIESDPLPKRSTASQATEAPETARGEQAQAETTDTEAATEEAATESGAESAGTAVAEAAGTESAAVAATKAAEAEAAESSSAPEMDGTRETTAEEIDDGGSSGGFVSWLKSLFGLS